MKYILITLIFIITLMSCTKNNYYYPASTTHTTISNSTPHINMAVCCGDAVLKQGDVLMGDNGNITIESPVTNLPIGNPLWQTWTVTINSNNPNIPRQDSISIQNEFPLQSPLYLVGDPNTGGPFWIERN